MKLKLIPEKNESHIFIKGEGDKRWSLLVPECVSCREGIAIHCHTIPPEWRRIKGGWEVKQKLERPECIYVTRLVALDEEVVELDFKIKNIGEKMMTDTEADFCFACAGAPWSTGPEYVDSSWVNSAFHGPRREFNTDWTKRSFVPTQAGLVPVGDINLHFPVAFNREVAGRNIADIPIILCQSVDRSEVYAAGWQRVSRLYCAVGSCIHTVVWLGTIPAGREVTRRGRFYYMKSDPYRALARFQRDFGI